MNTELMLPIYRTIIKIYNNYNMANKTKIDAKKALALVQQGLSFTEIANIFSVTAWAVQKKLGGEKKKYINPNNFNLKIFSVVDYKNVLKKIKYIAREDSIYYDFALNELYSLSEKSLASIKKDPYPIGKILDIIKAKIRYKRAKNKERNAPLFYY